MSQTSNGTETAPVQSVTNVGAESTATVVPTQMRRPWRATARTLFAAALALATLLPVIAAGIYEDADAYPAVVAQVLAVAGLITRIMAMPGVETFLQTYLPFLSAAGRPPQDPDPAGADERGLTVSELCLIAIAVVVVIVFLFWLFGSACVGKGC
jgi:hypothetical protein